jgi:hypothetical protein
MKTVLKANICCWPFLCDARNGKIYPSKHEDKWDDQIMIVAVWTDTATQQIVKVCPHCGEEQLTGKEE